MIRHSPAIPERLLSQTQIYPVQNWSLEMPQQPSFRPEPQYWIKFPDPWVQDFYPVLGWGWATSQGEHNSSQHRHCIKVGLPIWISSKSHRRWISSDWFSEVFALFCFWPLRLIKVSMGEDMCSRVVTSVSKRAF